MDAFYYWLGFWIFWFWLATVAAFIIAAIILSYIPAPCEGRTAKIDEGAI